MFVAAGTRDAIVEDLNRRLNLVLADPGLVKILTQEGYAVGGGTPELLGQALAQDIAAYTRILAAAGIAKQ